MITYRMITNIYRTKHMNENRCSENRYFIVGNCGQPIKFLKKTGKGVWVGRNGKTLESVYTLKDILERMWDWYIKEVNRKEFMRFVKSQDNQIVEE